MRSTATLHGPIMPAVAYARSSARADGCERVLEADVERRAEEGVAGFARGHAHDVLGPGVLLHVQPHDLGAVVPQQTHGGVGLRGGCRVLAAWRREGEQARRGTRACAHPAPRSAVLHIVRPSAPQRPRAVQRSPAIAGRRPAPLARAGASWAREQPLPRRHRGADLQRGRDPAHPRRGLRARRARRRPARRRRRLARRHGRPGRSHGRHPALAARPAPSGKDGLGNAYRAGFAWGLERDYDVVGQMDADLSHPPALLPAMLEAIWRGADLVLGSRYLPGGGSDGWPLHRRIASRIGGAASARGARRALQRSLRRLQAVARPRSQRSTSRPRARRATCSRSRRPSARTARRCASSRCRSRSATAAPASRRWSRPSRSRACAWSRGSAATAGRLSASRRPRAPPRISRRRRRVAPHPSERQRRAAARRSSKPGER